LKFSGCIILEMFREPSDIGNWYPGLKVCMLKFWCLIPIRSWSFAN